MMKNRLQNPIEYRGFTIQQEGDYLVLRDKFGNYAKRNPYFGKGSITDLKVLADKYIMEGTV